MYKFVVTRCGSERRQGYEGHRTGGGVESRGVLRLRDGREDIEESFNCPMGSECNR